MLEHIDAAFKLTAAFITAFFAVALLGAAPTARRWTLLAVFLGLIAANQAFEAARAVLLGSAADPVLLRMATVFAILDPPVFVLFTSAVAFAGRRRHGVWLGAIALWTGTLLAWALFTPIGALSRFGQPSFPVALTLFTLVCYGLAWGNSHRYFVEQSGGAGSSLLLLASTLALAPIPIRLVTAADSTRLAADLAPGFEITQVSVWNSVLAVAMAGLVVVAIAWRFRQGSYARRPTGAFYVALAACASLPGLFISLPPVASSFLIDPTSPSFEVVRQFGRSGAALRWMIFGLLASFLVLGQRDSPLPASMRETMARVFLFSLAVHLILMATILDVTWGRDDIALFGPVTAIIIALLLMTSDGFSRGIAALSRFAYGASAPATGNGSSSDLGAGFETRRAQAQDRTAQMPALGALWQGRYDVQTILGSGATGTTYRAFDQLLHREVALKVVRAESETDRAAALREARAAASIDSRNVLQILDVQRCSSGAVLVTELCDEGTLKARLSRGPPLSTTQAAQVAADVLSGLDAIHRQGLTHGDIKPANIFMTSRGAVLGDLGLTSLAQGSTLLPGATQGPAGTPPYIAPEVLAGGQVTPGADLYALGRTLGQLEAFREAPALAEISARAVEANPARRWASAAAMRKALEQRLQGATVPV